MRLLLWGISNTLKSCIEGKSFLLDEKQVIGYIDKDESWRGKEYKNRPVIMPDEVVKWTGKYDFILITSEKYKDEIFKQAIEISGTEGRIIPYEYLFPVTEQRYNISFAKLYNKEVQIVKNWYVLDNNECIILSVNKKAGYVANFKIVARGLGTDSNEKVHCKIDNVQNGEILYDGFVDSDYIIKVEVVNNLMILRCCISGLSRIFLSVIIEDREYTEMARGISNPNSREAFYFIKGLLYDASYHEMDYSFLDKLSTLKEFCILDIGANMGQSSLTFLKHSNMDVMAIEPQPIFNEPFELLRKEYEDRFSYVLCGMGSKEGEMTFYIPDIGFNYRQEASFNKERVVFLVRNILGLRSCDDLEGDKIKEIVVPVKTGDMIATSISKRILFIKIDAETYEHEIIKGMKKSIANDLPIMMIEHNGNYIMKQICDELADIANYRVLYWDYVHMRFTEENRCSSINYFLWPQDNEVVSLDNEGRIIIN